MDARLAEQINHLLGTHERNSADTVEAIACASSLSDLTHRLDID
jgi:hypothetical protein